MIIKHIRLLKNNGLNIILDSYINKDLKNYAYHFHKDKIKGR